MFIAKDENGNIITIEEAIHDNNGKYFCPTCGASLRIDSKVSDKKRTHFKHTKKCIDDWKYEMSEWHYNWQCEFPIECREVVMSNGVETHRADVFINNTVIEFQHSNITRDDFTARNKFYTSLGYDVIWVFDAKEKIIDFFEKSFNPLKPENISKNNGFFIKDYIWKREKTTFENFISFNNKVSIFLETKTYNVDEPIYLYIDPYNAKVIKAIYLDRYIKKNNLLKSFGVINNENIPDVNQLIYDYIHRYNQYIKSKRR